MYKPSNSKWVQKTATSVAIATTAALSAFGAKVQAATFTLPITSAANATGVTAARDLFGLDGTGIKIGVISDSFNTSEISFDRFGNIDNYETNIADGFLPAGIQVLRDFPDPTPGVVDEDVDPIDEGRAMLQIIHAIAPGASLAFYATPNAAAAYASPGDLQGYADGIRALAAAGANIIVDDIGFFNDPEPPFGPINQAIQDVYNLGVTYFSAAGNDYPDFPIFGHSNNPYGAAVGAVYYGNPPISPIDGVTQQGELEFYSSAGSPPYIKPDFVAPDGLETSFNLAQAFPLNPETGFFPFYGTSEAAPFAAAVAALLRQGAPNATPDQIFDALRSTAQPLGAPGFDYGSGYGLIQADDALLALGVTPVAVPEPSPIPGDLIALGVLAAMWRLKTYRQKKQPKLEPSLLK